MRKIEFRAYNKKAKEMIPPSLNMYIDSYYGTASWQFAFDAPVPMADTIVMQFTGLLDKHGVKIFEGDILICEGEKTKIEWGDTEACFNFLSLESDAIWNGRVIYTGRGEVIGNIWENPELIKDMK
jgi:uncharacterized phage protein (TIGR01671 family)